VSTAGQASPAWWAALPPAQTDVSCGEGTHRLLWQEGRLTASDHPDAEGELVVAALGGDRSECMDLVESWGARSDDLEVLAVGPRSAADELTINSDDIAELRMTGGGLMGGSFSWMGSAPLATHRLRPRPVRPWARMARGMATYGGAVRGTAGRLAAAQRRAAVRSSSGLAVAHLTAGSPQRIRPGRRQAHDETERAAARRAELLSLLALGPEFEMRLSATVAATWADGGSRAGDRDAGRPALVAALTGRLAPAARSWLGIDPGYVDVSLHEDAGWGRLVLSGAGRDRRLRAALPAGWLASVWAAGLAVTAGHLIVAVTEAAWPEATVLGLPEPGADPVILEVRVADGGWTVATAGNGMASGERGAR
jgi:hypothetical protein